MKFKNSCLFAASIIICTASPAFCTDWYKICYKQIESQYGPYTDINWMRKVWDCTEKHQIADGEVGTVPDQPNGPPVRKAKGCNFDKPTGACVGSIKIISTSGSKPSYSTEIRVTSSSGACSKVEYFVDGRPYTSVLRADGVENESLFGTSPIKMKNIEVTGCTAYEKK